MANNAVETPTISTKAVLGPIVIMEDDPRTIRSFKEIVQHFGGKIIVARSMEEVVHHAKLHDVRYFSLDIDMGEEGRHREGLEALQEIKKWWSEAFVVLLSNHSNLRGPATRLGCDFFRGKTVDRLSDVHESILAMLRHAELSAREAVRIAGSAHSRSAASDDTSEAAWKVNLERFLELRADPECRLEIVAIVDGDVVADGNDEHALQVLMEERFPHQDRLIGRVTGPVEEVDLDRPLEVTDLGNDIEIEHE